jgi:cell division protein FtsL
MRYRKSRLPGKIHLIAYFVLALYILVFFISAWFSSYQNRTALQLQREFEQQRDGLLDEINKLEMQEAELTSIERIHKIASELRMVLPAEQARILRAN